MDRRLAAVPTGRSIISLFDHTSGAAPAPPATADNATRSQWLTHDAATRLAIRNHLPLAECAHFEQHRTAQALDHFLALHPIALTVDLLEQHLLAAETSVVAVGAARGTHHTPYFEGCSSSPLAPSYASAAAVDILGAEDVGVASASGKRRSSKGKGGRGGGGGSGGGGGGSSGGGGGSGGGSGGGGSGGFGGGGGGSDGGGSSGDSGSGGSTAGAVPRGGSGGGQRQHQQRRSETPSSQQLRDWFSQRGASGVSGSCPYIIRTGDRVGQTCGKPHTQHRCFSRLDDAWRTEFGDEAERPRWAELLRYGVAIFDLHYDAILAAIYALSVSAKGDCYLCVPTDPSIEAAALGASESSLSSTALAEALHTFTLDSVLARSSTVLPCPAVPSSSVSGLHLPSFSTNLTLQWHHCPGHPSLPRLRGMHSRLLVSGLPRSLPPLPPLPAPPCLPCVVRQQRAAPHSSSFPPTTAPLQTLHMDMWGPARVSGQGRERYFLLVVDDYTCYTMVFPILQTFTLPASPQQNGIAECHIGLVIEVAHTSMIHAAAPHFLWLFAVRYVAHQFNLWPRASLPKTSPTLCWTGKVGDVSVFWVWVSHAFVRDTFADKLYARAISCVFLGFPPDAPGWQFYHPTSRRVFPSQDITFHKSVPFYRLFPYRSTPPPPSLLFLAPGPPSVDPLPPQGPAPSGVSQVDPLPSTVPVEVAVGSGAARGAASEGGASGGAESRVPDLGGAESGGAEPRVTASSGGLAGVSPCLSPQSEPLSLQQLREWFAQRTRLWSEAAKAGDPAAGDTGAGGVGVTLLGGAGVTAGARGTGGAAAAAPGGAHTRVGGLNLLYALQIRTLSISVGGAGARGAGAGDRAELGGAETGGTGTGGAGAGGAGAGDTGAVDPGGGGAGAGGAVSGGIDAGGTVRPRLYFIPLLQQCDLARIASPTVSHLLATAVTDPSFESTAVSALVAELSASPPSVRGECALGTDVLEFKQEDFQCLTAGLPRFASMLLAPEGDLDAPDIPTPRSYAEAITGPYSSQWQTAMDAEMASWKSTSTYIDAVPPSGANIVDGMWIFRVKRPPGSPLAFKARYVARGFTHRQGVDYFLTFSPTPKITTLRVLLHVAAQRDYELHSLDFSTAFLQGSQHEKIWLRRPPGFTGSFPAGTQWNLRRPVYGLRQMPHKWHDTLRTTLAPSTADPSLFLRTDRSLPPLYVLVYVDDLVFASANTEALTLVKSELHKRHTCTDLGELRSYLRLQITWDRARHTITLTQSHMVHQVLQRFGFQFSSPQPTPLSTGHSLSAPPLDESVEPSGPYPELMGCLITSGMGLVLRGRGPVVLTGHANASWVDDLATQRSSQGYTFSLGSGSVSWRSTRSSSVLNSSCEAEIYAGAMAV
ncbi:unnamed protein product [Closterium sp. NIES-53]